MGIHLFLSPHLDDAVLSCGGVMHRLAQSGERVVIVTVMAGEPDEPLVNTPVVQAIQERWNKGEGTIHMRRAEDSLAAQQLQAQVYYMALTESAFRATLCGAGDWIALYPEHDSPFQGINDADEARIILFGSNLPFPFSEITMLYAPFGVDNHVDHELVRDWALVLTGSVDAPPLKFYEEYPYARSKSAVQRAQTFYRKSLPALTIESEIAALNDDDLAAKLRAMSSYRSHLSILWNDPAEMESLTRDYMLVVGEGTPAERYWRVVR
jgi:LmbE family N-acetylglucosaminyl deacetylase